MPALALADFLTDFGAPSSVERTRPIRIATAQPAMAGIDPAEVELRIAQAVAEAEAALMARQEARWLVDRSELEARHAAELAAVRASLSEAAVDTIGTRFEAMEEALLERTGMAVARILGTVLSGQMQLRAVETLATRLRDILIEGKAVRLRISGPASLYEALVARIGEAAASLTFTETDAVDLTVAIDDALYTTRLADWSTDLAEVMA